jgi:hypothetical protein
MPQNDIQVRAAKKLASIIQSTKPKARVWSYWVLGQGPIGESYPDMLSDLEDEWASEGSQYVPWAHSYVIGYDAFARTKTANANFNEAMTFRLWAFYGFMKGTVDKNSADISSVHWLDVKNAISAATKMQQVDDVVNDPNGVPEVKQHHEWQITQAGIYWMGDHKVHIAQGEITVDARLIINMTTIGG